MPRAAKIDTNQTQLVHQLRQIGASVYPTHTVGGGFPDLVVGYRGVNYLFEVKNPTMPPSKQRLTPEEAQLHDTWAGRIHIVRTLDECLAILNR